MKRYTLIIIIILLSNNIFAQSQISNLITPVSYFIDHVQQLELLQDNLVKYRQASVVGVSGMGKTQLARMYTYKNKDKYDIIWFIDCNLDVNQQLLKLAKFINVQANSPVISDDTNIVRKELMTYLGSKDKWLLVFDNLKINENKKLEELINWEHNGNIIFCSQDSELLPNIIKMSSFNKKNSLTLLQNILKNENPALIEFLVQEFRGYPILMVQGVQLLNQVHDLGIEEYKKKIKVSNDKIGLNMKLVINELKPNTKNLLYKIALLNNQGFSKELLNIITNDTDSLDDDIYQLIKFALISNIDSDEINPVFEMHDIIAQKIIEMNGYQNNKNNLECIINKITQNIITLMRGTKVRPSKTINENLKVISDYQQFFKLSIYELLPINLQLFVNYINTFQFYEAEKLFNWFDKNDKDGKYKLWLMNNEEKVFYARYLATMARYYKTKFANWSKALEYSLRAKHVLDKVEGYYVIKSNVLYNLANIYVSLGQTDEAQDIINKIEQNPNFTGLGQVVRIMKSGLYHVIGNEQKALEECNKEIMEISKIYHQANSIKLDDILFLSNNYLLKAEILNSLSEYQEAYKLMQILYDAHASITKEDNEAFGRIFTQMSRAELGLGKVKKSLEYAEKAKTIFINDTSRNNNNLIASSDTDLAKVFVAEGDALLVSGENEKAVESYAAAEIIYYNNYHENMKNVDEISKMYLAATKAACKLPNKHWYSKFHNQHMEKFGQEHPRSIEILNLKCFD
ncbi:MAG TPA: tetratricopeptide repeat protein [Rickettsia endosymbiont of Omalisus fontisbellaquei]|nr:tetratricopeptide repeat protein [Rickettsia endosymbiont of Omalisus fontisbellaquei]